MENFSQDDGAAMLDVIDPATGGLRADVKTYEPSDSPETGLEPEQKVDTQADEKIATETSPEAGLKTEAVAEKKPHWKEVVTDADKAEILAHYGLDEFDIQFAETRKNGGDPYKFLEVKTRNWEKVSDDDVILYDLKQKYGHLPEEKFSVLADEALELYKVEKPAELDDLATDKEREEYERNLLNYEKKLKSASLKKELAAEEIRKKYKEEDSKYTIPERKPDDEQAKRLEAAEKMREQHIEFVNNNEHTHKLLTEKQLVFGSGENIYKVDVDPQEILPYAIGEKNIFSLFDETDKNGNPVTNMNKLYKLFAYALKMDEIENGIADHGKSIGTRREADSLGKIPADSNGKPGEQSLSILDHAEIANARRR